MKKLRYSYCEPPTAEEALKLKISRCKNLQHVIINCSSYRTSQRTAIISLAFAFQQPKVLGFYIWLDLPDTCDFMKTWTESERFFSYERLQRMNHYVLERLITYFPDEIPMFLL